MKLVYRPEIDGLRAIAVTAVLMFHLFPEILPGGYLGVDVFFVISGYLMTKIISRDLSLDTFSFKFYYSNRIRRIFPALLVVMIFSLILGWAVLFEDEFSSLASSIVAGVGFLANWYFYQNRTEYFADSSIFQPFMHLWSLSVEEQVYLVLPGFFWCVHKRKVNKFAAFGVVSGISFILYFFLIKSSPLLAFYLMPSRFWELSVGGMIALRPFRKSAGNILMNVGIVFIFAVFSFPKDFISPVFLTLSVVIATLVLIDSESTSLTHRILSHRVLTTIGLCSYSIYLWHLPLLVFSRIIHSSDLSPVIRIILISSSYFLGYLSWRFIELPARKAKICWPWITGMIILGVFCAMISFRPESLTNPSSENTTDPFSHIRSKGKVEYHWPLDNSPELVLIGDSHAQDKIYGIKRKDKRSWGFLTQTQCAPLLDVQDRWNPLCPLKMQKFLSLAVDTKSVRTVILAHNGDVKFDEKYGSKGPYITGLRNSVRFLVENGKKVVILIDIPRLNVEIRDCHRDSKLCNIPRENVWDGQKIHRPVIAALKKEFPMIVLFDPLPIFCPGKICHFEREQHILYADSNHLSKPGSDFYAEEFLKAIQL